MRMEREALVMPARAIHMPVLATAEDDGLPKTRFVCLLRCGNCLNACPGHAAERS